jgi:hypoxanthine-DNA glycosylase
VKSREAGFYYHHPQNRFWRVLAALFDEEVPQTIAARRAFLLRHHIALWDVIADCEVTGSADTSIRDPHPNDIPALLRATRIRAIFCNGALAYRLWCRYAGQALPAAHPLPSTSPANAAYSLSRLTKEWQAVREALTDFDDRF